jgi:hypothetical protein
MCLLLVSHAARNRWPSKIVATANLKISGIRCVQLANSDSLSFEFLFMCRLCHCGAELSQCVGPPGAEPGMLFLSVAQSAEAHDGKLPKSNPKPETPLIICTQSFHAAARQNWHVASMPVFLGLFAQLSLAGQLRHYAFTKIIDFAFSVQTNACVSNLGRTQQESEKSYLQNQHEICSQCSKSHVLPA